MMNSAAQLTVRASVIWLGDTDEQWWFWTLNHTFHGFSWLLCVICCRRLILSTRRSCVIWKLWKLDRKSWRRLSVDTVKTFVSWQVNDFSHYKSPYMSVLMLYSSGVSCYLELSSLYFFDLLPSVIDSLPVDWTLTCTTWPTCTTRPSCSENYVRADWTELSHMFTWLFVKHSEETFWRYRSSMSFWYPKWSSN